MRVSTDQLYSQGLERMQTVQASITDLQGKISTGKSLSQPSDDPVAFARALQLTQEIDRNDQFQENIRVAKDRNELSDTMMVAAQTTLQRIREIGLQASNDTLSIENRASLGVEVRILQQELASIMNARDGSGEYIFAGFQGQGEPFVKSIGGQYRYEGDEGQRQSQVSNSNSVAITDSGKALFERVPAAENTVLTRDGENNSQRAGIGVGQVLNQSKLDQVYPEKFVIKFNDPAENQNRRSFSVTRRSDGAPVQGDNPPGSLEDITFVSGEPIQFHGIQVQISGDPQAGDQFYVESSNSQSIMDTIERLAFGLETLASSPRELSAEQSLIGQAAPPRSTLSAAGNYVAGQQLSVLGEDGSVQTLQVAPNSDIATVAANLDALSGISASFTPARAIIDLSTTNADEGDLLEFRVNGTLVQATAGATNADTIANVDTALAAVLPLPDLTYSQLSTGQFEFEQTTGLDLAITDFNVTDFVGVELSIQSGVSLGETISFELVGSNGEVVPVNYTAISGDDDELATRIQAAVAGAGFTGEITTSQSAPGAPVALRYTGDINGNAQLSLRGLTDNNNNNLVLSATPAAGTNAVQEANNGRVQSLQAGVDVAFQAQESRSTLGVQGSRGSMVSLRDAGNDSTAVAAQLGYTLDTGYTLESSVALGSGGLVEEQSLDNTLTNRFRAILDTSLSNLDNALDNTSTARSTMGARLNMLDASQAMNEAVTVQLQEFRSRLEDLDYAEAITELQQKTFVLQAAQNTFAQVARLSLFNYL